MARIALAWELGAGFGRQGLAHVFSPRRTTQSFAAAIRRLLDDARCTDAARRFAGRHAGHDIDAAVAGIADACEAALDQRAAGRPAGAAVGA